MRLLVSAVAAVAVLAVAGTVLAGDTATPLAGKISLVGTVVERHSVFADQDGFPGRETWYFSLASVRAKGKRFGYEILSCSYVSTATSVRQCTGTFSLPEGKISVAGSFLYSNVYQLAVTGGTDLYVGVGGVLVARQFVRAKTTYWLTFQLG